MSRRALKDSPKPAKAQNQNTRTYVNTKSAVKPKSSRKGMNFKGIFTVIKDNIYYLLIPALIGFLYLFKINTLPKKVTDGSLSLSHNNLTDIDSADFLPIKLVAIGFDKLGVDNLLDIRVFSTALFLFSIFCFYKVITAWLGKSISVIAIILYASSTWFISQARHDIESIMITVLVPITLYTSRLLVNSDSKIVRITSALIIAQFVFVPGGIWFVIASLLFAVISARDGLNYKKLILPCVVFLSSLAAYAVLLLEFSLTGFGQLIRLVGFQIGSLPGIGTIKANITELPSQLFVNGVNDGSLWLYRTPIIDWVTLIFLIVGLTYFVSSKNFTVRTKYIVTITLLSLILIFLNGPLYISLLLPSVYIIVATGIKYLKHQWFAIFPNNPLARGFGALLILISIMMVSGYHIERYFIGWPETEKYQQVYNR